MRIAKRRIALALTALVVATAGFAQVSLVNDDVVALVDAGLSAELVTQIVNTQPSDFDLDASALVSLGTRGVPDEVIAALVGGSAADEVVVVPAGTPVRVRTVADLDSSTATQREPLSFEVIAPVEVEGHTVIAAGSAASGEVVQATRKKGFGRRGKLEFRLDSVTAVDGSLIGASLARSVRGDDSYSKAGVVTLLTGPFGIFVKGKDIRVPAGTEYTLFTTDDSWVGR